MFKSKHILAILVAISVVAWQASPFDWSAAASAEAEAPVFTGYILDAASTGVSEVTVSVFQKDAEIALFSVETDRYGKWQLEGLSYQVTYRLEFQKDGYTFPPEDYFILESDTSIPESICDNVTASVAVPETAVPAATDTPTPAPTDTPTPIPTDTPTPVPTDTPIPVPAVTPEPATDTPTPAETETVAPADTLKADTTAEAAAAETAAPEATATDTPAPTAVEEAATDTPAPAETQELAETETTAPTDTPEPDATAEAAAAETIAPEATVTDTPSPTAVEKAATDTPAPAETQEPADTPEVTETETIAPTDTSAPAETETIAPTDTPTIEPSVSPDQITTAAQWEQAATQLLATLDSTDSSALPAVQDTLLSLADTRDALLAAGITITPDVLDAFQTAQDALANLLSAQATAEPTATPTAQPQGSVSISIDPVYAQAGDTVTLTATVTGYAGAAYQWQWAEIPTAIVSELQATNAPDAPIVEGADATALVWNSEPGATDTVYSFTATEENLNRYWRILIILPETTEPEATPAGSASGRQGETKAAGLLSLILDQICSHASADGQTTITSEGYASLSLLTTSTIPVCEIPETGVQYASLSTALAAAASGQTIRLLSDITYTDSLVLAEKSIRLATNGCTLTVSATGIGVSVTSGSLSLDTAVGGSVNVYGTTYGVYVSGTGSVEVTSASGTQAGGIGVYAAGGGTVTVHSTVTATASAGTGVQASASTVTVGSVTADQRGVSAADGARVTVNGSITTDNDYLSIGGTVMAASAFANPPAPALTGYRTYTDGTTIVWVKGTAPTIAGAASVILTKGYSSAYQTQYTITGDGTGTVAVGVTGSATITAAGLLTIPTGLIMAGSPYTLLLTAGNGVSPDTTLTVTVTIQQLSLSPADKTFPAAAVGYGAQNAQTFIVGNADAGTTITGLTASLADGSAFAITGALSANSLAAGATATVSAAPKTGLAAGTYTDTLTVSGSDGARITAALSFTVSETPVTGVSLNTSAITLNTGSAQTLTATVTPANATNQTVVWTSSNPAVATVTNSGVVTAVAAGTATITAASAENSAINSTCTVTVVQVTFGYNNLAAPSGELVVGNSYAIAGTQVYSNATITSLTAGVYWRSGTATGYVQTVYPNAASYTISGTVDTAIKFGKLGTGDYMYQIAATAGGVTQVIATTYFTEIAGVSFSCPTLYAPSGTLTTGYSYSLEGTVIQCNAVITSLTVGVYYRSSGNATSYVETVYPNASSYTISNTLDNAIKFGNLSSGSYVYKITATAANQTHVVISRNFTEESAGTSSSGTSSNNSLSEAVSISCTTLNAPSGTLAPGDGFTVTGTVVKSNYKIYSLTAGIYTSTGSTKYVKTVYPGATSYTFGSTINSTLAFDKLAEGDYTYKITATSGGETEVVARTSFTVKAEITFDCPVLNAPSGTLAPGTAFSAAGTVVESNQAITSLTAGIYYNTGIATAYVETLTPNATAYTLPDATNSALLFNALDTGSYVYKITATAGGVTQIAAISHFTVTDSAYGCTNLQLPPAQMLQGDTVSVSGTVITAEQPITTVWAAIYADSASTPTRVAEFYPNAASYTLPDTVNDTLLFSTLEPGTYEYKILASPDGATTEVAASQSFTVYAAGVTVLQTPLQGSDTVYATTDTSSQTGAGYAAVNLWIGPYRYSNSVTAGTAVYPVASGTVVSRSTDGTVVVKHTTPLVTTNGVTYTEWYSQYAHLELSDTVQAGSTVTPSTALGTVAQNGTYGLTYGATLQLSLSKTDPATSVSSTDAISPYYVVFSSPINYTEFNDDFLTAKVLENEPE